MKIRKIKKTLRLRWSEYDFNWPKMHIYINRVW